MLSTQDAVSVSPAGAGAGRGDGRIRESGSVNVWRAGPAASSALLVLATALVLLVLLEAGASSARDDLGHTGPGLRAVVVPSDAAPDAAGLTAAMLDVLADSGASAAYSRGYGTGLVTLADADGRFRGHAGPLAGDLDEAGPGPAASVSATLPVPRDALGLAGRPGDPVVTGTFTADVTFEGREPLVLYNTDAVPFGEGVYLFAADADLAATPAFLERLSVTLGTYGYEIGHLEQVEPTGTRTIAASLRSPYGVVVALFGAVSAASHVVVLHIYAALRRDRLMVAAVLGASRRALRTSVRGMLAGRAAAGAALGAVAAVAIVLGSAPSALAPTGARWAAAGVALLVGLAVTVVSCEWVARAEVRRATRVVPG